MSSAPHDRPSVPWLLGQSAWMLTTVIPGAVLAWAGFLFVGFAGRMPRWIVVGALLGGGSILAHAPLWGQYRSVAISSIYIIGMLLALWANPQWLRFRWQRVATGRSLPAQRAARGAPPPRATPPSRAQRREQSRRRQREQRAAAQRSVAEQNRRRKAEQQSRSRDGSSASRDEDAAQSRRLAESAGASTSAYFAASEDESPTEPVDVNTASANEIARLPGLTRSKARQLVKQRDKIGGFGSLDAFAFAAELQPHELVRLRSAATCSPRPRGPRTFGRRVDY